MKGEQLKIFDLIMEERKRQDRLWGADRSLPNSVWITILIEEIGEAAQALLKCRGEDLKIELIHSAAVLFAWLENIFREEKSK